MVQSWTEAQASLDVLLASQTMWSSPSGTDGDVKGVEKGTSSHKVGIVLSIDPLS
jgi:hypothetical protein